jgi:hypothetical protein
MGDLLLRVRDIAWMMSGGRHRARHGGVTGRAAPSRAAHALGNEPFAPGTRR